MAGPRALYLDCSPAMRALLEGGLQALVPDLQVHDGDPAEAAIPEKLRGVSIALNGHTPMPAALLRACPDLTDIVFLGTGASSYIDLRAAAAQGITVHTIRDYGSRSVAEHALALALSAARNVARMDRELRAGHWQPRQGTELGGRVLSVIGAGPIGREMIRLGAAFGMTVLAWSRSGVDPALPCRATDLDAALAEGDVVSLHLALTAETRGLIDARALGLMKPGAILVNTARGGVIDESALIAALEAGRPGHAALDVFDTEPLPPGHPLAGHPDVTLTAHSGFNTSAASEALLRQALSLARDLCQAAPSRAPGDTR